MSIDHKLSFSSWFGSFAPSRYSKGTSLSCYNSIRKSYLNSGLSRVLFCQMKRHTQALHTYRINLSPFTKDFRVGGHLLRLILFILELPSGSFPVSTIFYQSKYILHQVDLILTGASKIFLLWF